MRCRVLDIPGGNGGLLELTALIRSIQQDGQKEDGRREWKRGWPDLSTDDGKREFRKDVVGLANAPEGDEPRQIIYGIGEDGTLADAPCPKDGAIIEQLINDLVSPSISLRLQPHVVDGRKVVVLELRPPFDPPYVLQDKTRRIIHVRRGSAISEARREDLDLMYSRKLAALREPSLKVSWWPWSPIGALPIERRPEVLEVPGPDYRSSDDVRAHFDRELRRGIAAGGENLEARAAEFSRLIAGFLKFYSTEELLSACYANARLGARVGIGVHNDGSAPATDLRLTLRPPKWLLCYQEGGEGRPGFVGPGTPAFPGTPRPERQHVVRGEGYTIVTRPPQDYVAEGRRLRRDARQRQLAPWEFAASAVGIFAAGPRVLHHEAWDWDFRVLALPGAPEVGIEHEVAGTVFCAEFTEPRPIALRVRVGEPAEQS